MREPRVEQLTMDHRNRLHMKKLILLLTLIAFGLATSVQVAEAAPARPNARAHVRQVKAKRALNAKKKGKKRAAKKKNVRKQGNPRRGKA